MRRVAWIPALFVLAVSGGGVAHGDADPLPVARDGKWGFIDRSGRLVIPARFAKAGDFETIWELSR